MENPQCTSDSFGLSDRDHRNVQSTSQLPSSSEVVIIGGGISGVSDAYPVQLKGCCHEMQLGQIRGLKQRNQVK